MESIINPATLQAIQVAFVTEDADSTAAWFAELIGEPIPDAHFTPSYEVSGAQFKGEPAPDSGCKQIVFNWNGLIVEFIEPIGGDSTWREWLERRGPGVHHLGFFIDDIAVARTNLEQAGFPAVQHGDWETGKYAYMDTEKRLGAYVELLQRTGPRAH